MNFVDFYTILIVFSPSSNLPRCLSRRNQLSTTLTTRTRYHIPIAWKWLGRPILTRMGSYLYEKQLNIMELNRRLYGIELIARSHIKNR